jgi:hypothetical protein
MRASEPFILVGALCALAAAACDEPAGLEPGRPRPGVLQLVGYEGGSIATTDETVRWSVAPEANVLIPPRMLEVPDTVAAGETFEVDVRTIGLNGCWSAAGLRLEERAGVIEVTPTDAHSGAGVCTEILLDLDHRTSVAIATPGDWTIRVRGRRVGLGVPTWEEPVAAETTVVVR